MNRFSEKDESVILQPIVTRLNRVFDQQEFGKKQIYKIFEFSRSSSFMQKVNKIQRRNFEKKTKGPT